MGMRNFKRRKNDNAEQRLQRLITRWVELHGGWIVKYNAIPSYQRSDGSKAYFGNVRTGIPDLIVCWKGQFVGIEVKRPAEAQTDFTRKRRPAGKLNENQIRELEAIRRASGIAIVAYSLEDVISALQPAVPTPQEEV